MSKLSLVAIPNRKNSLQYYLFQQFDIFSSKSSMDVAGGMVLGISIKVVTPPAAAPLIRYGYSLVCEIRLSKVNLMIINDALGLSNLIKMNFPDDTRHY